MCRGGEVYRGRRVLPYSFSPHTHVHLVQKTVFTCTSHSKEWHVVCSLPPAVEHQPGSASNSSCQSM